MPTTLRTFLALTLEAEARETLVRLGLQLCKELEPNSGQLRPTRPEQLHLTIAFLGDTPSELVPDISAIAAQVACRHVAPTLHADRVVYLPQPRHARVMALAFTDERGRAESLASDLASSLSPLGFAFEQRPFLPHVTLLRSRKPLHVRAEESVAPMQTPSQIVLRLRELTYFASFLESNGARHELLSTTSLRTLPS